MFRRTLKAVLPIRTMTLQRLLGWGSIWISCKNKYIIKVIYFPNFAGKDVRAFWATSAFSPKLTLAVMGQTYEKIFAKQEKLYCFVCSFLLVLPPALSHYTTAAVTGAASRRMNCIQTHTAGNERWVRGKSEYSPCISPSHAQSCSTVYGRSTQTR